MSRAFALLGRPVGHSVSPAMLRAAFEELGLEATYDAVEVASEGFAAELRRWADRGGGNVTLPHKERAATLLDRPSEAVRATGACNCFWLGRDGALAGDNTDVGGIEGELGELVGDGGLDGGRVLLLGAGGAARAALVACARAGVATVDVWNRTPSRARRMVEALASVGVEARALDPAERLSDGYDVAIQATRLGLDRDDPLPPSAVGRARAALDLVYGPGETPWVRRARAAGLRARDGLGTLVRQAALSLLRWFPGVEPPSEAMRAAAERALVR